MKKITGAQAIMETLLRENVDMIFGYPGGSIMPTYDALYDFRDRVRHVLVRHEQGAAHAAEGYAKATGKVGVCLVTSGPGATNLLTGITNAMMDSTPLVCITGQIPSILLGTNGFQEAPITAMSAPVTKWSRQVTRAEEIPHVLKEAFHIARSGRPGPVLVDITKDAQMGMYAFRYPKKIPVSRRIALPAPTKEVLDRIAHLLNTAERPLVLIGQGIRIAGAEKELIALVEKGGFPVASTLLGLSVMSSKHSLFRGMLGMHGNYAPNMLTNRADVIFAIGLRFDDRVTGKVSAYAKQAKIIHIDIDAAELSKIVKPHLALHADAKVTLQKLLPRIKKCARPAWLDAFDAHDKTEEEKVHRHVLSPQGREIRMAEVVRALDTQMTGEAIIVADVGQHQMTAARYYRFRAGHTFITSGGLGTMGFALPASIGAKAGAPQKTVVALMGDGSAQMNIQELGTLMQARIPLKIIILNNSNLGMVRQWQELFFKGRYSFVAIESPEYTKIAEAYHIPAERVVARTDMKGAIARMLRARGSYLLEICVHAEEKVFPIIPSGASVEESILE